jgi:hypothetical protein
MDQPNLFETWNEELEAFQMYQDGYSAHEKSSSRERHGEQRA